MRFPVTAGGSLQEFKDKWYVATGFDIQRTGENYIHEGADINLLTGGDTDFGQELKAIANGKVVYYHQSSHPNTVPSFGRHLVVKIDGPWGTRWVHYAHMDSNGFLGASHDVTEGQIVGHIGKSGTTVAHLHFSIFKKDPASVGGIDRIARTHAECNDIWEDPINFINTWMQPLPPAQPVITDSTVIPQIYGWEVQKIRSELAARDQKISDLVSKIAQAKSILG